MTESQSNCSPANCSLTVDVEEWFHSHNLKPLIREDDWKHCESRVEWSTMRILEILARRNTPATFFVLGWVAERHPGLVRSIAEAGHEVASHGYGHELVYSLGPRRFRADVCRSKQLLEDIVGHKVRGYRAPCFSIVDWALHIIRELEFEYDASLYPVVHHRYGRIDRGHLCDPISEVVDGLYEAQVSTLRIGRAAFPWGGGGYFRLCPFPIWMGGVRRILRSGAPYVFYIHPWEIDTNRPRIPGLRGVAAFRHNVGLAKCEDRLAGLLKSFGWCTLGDLVDQTKICKSGSQHVHKIHPSVIEVPGCAG